MALHRKEIDWYRVNRRDLPWRHDDCSPWGILVSEIMLQQTPVVRVLPRWEAWMARWPTPEACANAPTSEILKMWDRLGYPKRALRLQQAAQEITRLGHFPTTYDELLELPGVGDYTASAVSCFAFKHRETVIDTNIRRVEARAVTGTALPSPNLNAAEKKLAASLIPKQQGLSVEWNEGVMELGALVCKAKNPLCEECPLIGECQWIKNGRPEQTYQPKGQAWKGTDRQVRGAIMAILRAAESPVEESIVTQPYVDADVASENIVPEITKLEKINAPAEQRKKAVNTLATDGLLVKSQGKLKLP